MMGRQTHKSGAFVLRVLIWRTVFLRNHLLRRINVISLRLRWRIFMMSWRTFYSHTGRPSVDPELMIRMLIVGYSYGIRSERRLCEEVSA